MEQPHRGGIVRREPGQEFDETDAAPTGLNEMDTVVSTKMPALRASVCACVVECAGRAQRRRRFGFRRSRPHGGGVLSHAKAVSSLRSATAVHICACGRSGGHPGCRRGRASSRPELAGDESSDLFASWAGPAGLEATALRQAEMPAATVPVTAQDFRLAAGDRGLRMSRT